MRGWLRVLEAVLAVAFLYGYLSLVVGAATFSDDPAEDRAQLSLVAENTLYILNEKGVLGSDAGVLEKETEGIIPGYGFAFNAEGGGALPSRSWGDATAFFVDDAGKTEAVTLVVFSGA